MIKRILWISVLVLILSPLGYCNYPGDCNGDRVVDDFDFNLVITNFGNNYGEVSGPGDCFMNYPESIVDDFDFNAVITNFGADYRNIIPGEMVYIPAGEFLMGNSGVGDDAFFQYGMVESPQHSVYLSDYWIGKYEVTRGEYLQFMNAGGYSYSSYWSTEGWNWKVANNRTQPANWWWESWGGRTFQTDSHPVVGVSYYEAEAYCNWAGSHLPTEAQWEKAARWNPINNHPNVYPWGDSWVNENCNHACDSQSFSPTTLVGSYPTGASPYGCMDMMGNVWEWCQDWSKSYPDSISPFDYTGIYRVLRGGGWDECSGGYTLRCAYRLSYAPTDYSTWGNGSDVGFRLVRD